MLPAGDQDEVELQYHLILVELIEIINKIIIVASAWLFIYIIVSVMHGHTDIKFNSLLYVKVKASPSGSAV